MRQAGGGEAAALSSLLQWASSHLHEHGGAADAPDVVPEVAAVQARDGRERVAVARRLAPSQPRPIPPLAAAHSPLDRRRRRSLRGDGPHAVVLLRGFGVHEHPHPEALTGT